MTQTPEKTALRFVVEMQARNAFDCDLPWQPIAAFAMPGDADEYIAWASARSHVFEFRRVREA